MLLSAIAAHHDPMRRSGEDADDPAMRTSVAPAMWTFVQLMERNRHYADRAREG